jgi:hypothetical protein
MEIKSKNIGQLTFCISISVLLVISLICLSPVSVKAGGAVCISDIDHYYNIAVQQYNQGDYLNAHMNFYVWYIGSYCRHDIDRGFLEQFNREAAILGTLVRDSVNVGKNNVLRTYSSGGGVSGKGDSWTSSGKRMPYFPPTFRRR